MSVIVVQPAIPAYRVPLFRRMADALGPDFCVYASHAPELGDLNANDESQFWQRSLGPLRPVAPGLNWQPGAVSIPLKRGDTLVVSGAPRTISTLALLVKARLKGVRTMWWGHYWTATSKRWRAALRFMLMGLSEAVLFYTDQEVAEYRAREGGGRSDLLFGLNNGIETDEIVALRRPYVLGDHDRDRDILFIGRLTEKAELPLLLRALAVKSCAAVRLDVIGDGPALAEFRQLASELGVSDRIAWHGSTTDERRIAEVANRCKVFVYPGSVGLSLIHAFAYGLPAIVHDDRWTHMPEVTAHRAGQTGSVFAKGSAASLAEAIADLLGDKDRLVANSQAVTATVDQTYNARDMAQRFCAAIAALNSNKRASA